MARRVPLHTTISKESRAIINKESKNFGGKINAGVEHICLTYAGNRDILDDPEAMKVARAYIRDRSRRLPGDEY